MTKNHDIEQLIAGQTSILVSCAGSIVHSIAMLAEIVNTELDHEDRAVKVDKMVAEAMRLQQSAERLLEPYGGKP